jgi:CheY-like chemotaxis protein
MRILIADDAVSQVLISQVLVGLARYGSIDIVQNGRAAVLAYVNIASKGAFYDLIILDQHLAVLDGFATVAMIRTYESKHCTFGKRTMACVMCSEPLSQQQYEKRYGADERTHLLCKPASLAILETVAGSVVAELARTTHAGLIPMPMRLPAVSRVMMNI